MPSSPYSSVPYSSTPNPSRPQKSPEILAAEGLKAKGIKPTKERIQILLQQARKIQQRLNSTRPSTTSLSSCVREALRSHHKKQEVIMSTAFQTHYRIARAADAVLADNPALTFEQAVSKSCDHDPSLYDAYCKVGVSKAKDDIGKLLVEAFEEAQRAAGLTPEGKLPTLEDAANAFFIRHPEKYQAWLNIKS